MDADEGSLTKALAKATASGSKAPIPVITYRDVRLGSPAEDRIEALTGVIAPTAEQPLARTRTFAQPLLGTFGEVTAEMVEKSDGRYEAGDRAGRSGLQAQYDDDAGRRDRHPGHGERRGGATLFEKARHRRRPTSRPPSTRPCRMAAEKALADANLEVPGAVVAIDVRSGEVLAVANSPTSGFDRALTGHYPPGSTFKVATSYAYLTRGITTPDSDGAVPGIASPSTAASSPTSPASRSAAARPSSRTSPSRATRRSSGLSGKLGDDDLTTAAKALGIGAGWGDDARRQRHLRRQRAGHEGRHRHRGGAIGQGRVEVSPVSLAVMAGSVGRGTFVPPVLVGDRRGRRPGRCRSTARRWHSCAR